MAGNWIVKSQAGTLTAAPVANAPNVSFASASVALSLWSHSTQFSFSGTINLPTSDPDYSHLKQIDLIAYGPAGKIVPVATLMSAEFTGSTISFSGGPNPFSSSAPESWTLKAWALNEDSVATSSPATASLTVTPPAITGLSDTGTDDIADRWVDANRSVYAPQIVAFAGGAMTFTLWIFDGVRNNWQGWYTVQGNQTFKIGLKGSKEIIFAPPANATWTLKGAPGAWEGNDDNGWRCPDLGLGSRPIVGVPGLYASAGYSVTGMQKPAANEIPSLTIPVGSGGTFPYNHVLLSGYQEWAWGSMLYDDSGCSINARAVTLIAQDYDASDNPIGPPHRYGNRAIGGGVQDFGPINGPYGSVANPARTGILAKVALRVYVSSRKNESEDAWADSTTSTLQTSIGTSGLLLVTVAVGGAEPAIYDKSVTVTAKGVSVNTSNLSSLIYDGYFSNGGDVWTFLSGALESTSFAYSSPSYWRDGMNSFGGVEQGGVGCRAGDIFYGEVFVNAGFGTISGDVFLSLQFYDNADVAISGGSGGNPFSSLALSAGMGWTQLSLTATAPAGASSVLIRVQIGTASGTGFWYIDNVLLAVQTATGDGMEPSGRGGVKWKAGKGLGVNATTKAAEVKVAGPLYTDVTDNLTIRIANDFVVATVGGLPTLSQAVVNLALASGFGTEFTRASGLFVINAIAVNKLVAGDALFAGQATFAYNGGGKVTINSAGIALADSNFSPTATVTITSSGVTVAKGGSSVQVTAAGVAITNGTLVNTSGSIAISIDQSNYVNVSNSASSVSTQHHYAYFRVQRAGDALWYSALSLSDLQLSSSGGANLAELAPTFFKVTGLPGFNPGSGTKQFWYDPTDGNRVKFAA